MHELQRERMLLRLADVRAADGRRLVELAGIRAQVDEQRERTDDAMAVAAPLIGDTGGGDEAMTASMMATSGRLDDLAVVRQSVDANQVDAVGRPGHLRPDDRTGPRPERAASRT